MVWKSEKGERQRPLPREKENRGHGKDADKRKPQTRRNGIARESKSGKTCGTRCSLLIIIAPGSWSVEKRLPPPCIRMLPGHPVWVLPMGVDSPRRKAVPDRCQGAFLLRRNHRKRRRLPNLSRNPAAGGAEASQYQEVSLYRKGKRQGETCQNAPHQTGQRGKRHPFGPKLQPNWKNSLPGSP